jgi:large subunit ribosomal protein L7A
VLTKLMQGKTLVGVKQSRRAIKEGKAETVFIARDADSRLKGSIEELCEEKGIRIEYVPTMQELGDICGIEVGAAVATMLK